MLILGANIAKIPGLSLSLQIKLSVFRYYVYGFPAQRICLNRPKVGFVVQASRIIRISGQERYRLRLMVVVPNEQAHAEESQQELEGYDENVYHNG